MSTSYTHFTNLAFDSLFARGPNGSEVPIVTSGGTFTYPAIQVGAGTVSAPSLQIGSTALGLYRVSANSLGFATNGVLQASIDSAGLFTIGSNSAVNTGSGLLNLNQTSGSGIGPIQFFNIGGTHYSFMGVDRAGNQVITGASAGDMCFGAASQRFLFSTDNGTSIHAQIANGLTTLGKNGEVGVHTVNGALTVTGTITGSLTGAVTGNASTATVLQTARTINGTSFNGSANITVTADASTLTNTTLNSTVVTSSLTSVGTLTSLTVSGVATTSTAFRGPGGGNSAPTYSFTGSTNYGFWLSGTSFIITHAGTATYAITSTQIQGADGTLANPGYSFVSGTGMGMRRVGANILALNTSGADAISIDASQNVTIGSGSSNKHVLNTSTATSATAGANGAVPAQVVGYVIVTINGTDRKIPYFAT